MTRRIGLIFRLAKVQAFTVRGHYKIDERTVISR